LIFYFNVGFSTSIDDHTSITPPQTESINNVEQGNIGENHSSPPDVSDETHACGQTDPLSRWQPAWDEHERQQQQQEIIELAKSKNSVNKKMNITIFY
jgi:hypothetical protein